MKNLHLVLSVSICLLNQVGLYAHGDKKETGNLAGNEANDSLLKQKITLGQAPYSFELVPDGISL